MPRPSHYAQTLHLELDLPHEGSLENHPRITFLKLCFVGSSKVQGSWSCIAIPEDPSTQYLDTWDWGNSNSSTGLGQVHDYWVLGLLGNVYLGGEPLNPKP